MDARSIAATARSHGVVTSAADVSYDAPAPVSRRFDASVYEKPGVRGFGHPQPEAELQFGPNIAEWPPSPPWRTTCSCRWPPSSGTVTTTDELIPSGETSSYRSNP